MYDGMNTFKNKQNYLLKMSYLNVNFLKNKSIFPTILYDDITLHYDVNK